jgi:FkbH-like protein
LCTRRLSESELEEWAAEEQNSFWVFRVSDKYGDSGLTAIGSFSVLNGQAQITDFILSCRVMGRKVEETITHWLTIKARLSGAKHLMAQYLPTEKNKPCLDYWQRSGFENKDNCNFTWNLENDYALPECANLINLSK